MDITKLRKLQFVEIEILDEIVRICNRYNITYYLIAGSLLGAVRHKGFIPWDDDIDIAMPREDYNKFKEICKYELNSKYFLQDSESEPSYWLAHSKVRKNGTLFEETGTAHLNIHKGIFVDIFILDHARKQPEQSFSQFMQNHLFKLVQAMIYYKTNDTIHRKISLGNAIAFFSYLFRLESLKFIREKVMTINKDKNSLYYVNLACQYGYKKQTMPKDVYNPPVKVEFEGKYYNAPKNWDYYLNRIYGNYMELPPEEKRVNHNASKILFNLSGEDKPTKS